MVKSALASVTCTAIAAIILQAQAAPLIRLAQTIPLEEVKGHFAHFGFDANGHGKRSGDALFFDPATGAAGQWKRTISAPPLTTN